MGRLTPTCLATLIIASALPMSNTIQKYLQVFLSANRKKNFRIPLDLPILLAYTTDMIKTSPAHTALLTFPAASISDVLDFARQHCNDGRCWVLTVCFGKAFAAPYPYPSAIPYSAYGDTDQFGHRYWRDGEWQTFPKKSIAKYENTGLGISD